MTLDTARFGVMNDTKWSELRNAMLGIASQERPRFQIKDFSSPDPWPVDGEWYYHFCAAPYSLIEWVDLHLVSEHQRDEIRARLIAIHLPGYETDIGFRVLGYCQSGIAVGFIGDQV